MRTKKIEKSVDLNDIDPLLSQDEKIILETLINFLPMAAHLSLFDIEQILSQTCFNTVSKKFHRYHLEEVLVFEENYHRFLESLKVLNCP